MTWQELIANRPDIATFWGFIFAASGAVFTLAARGLLQVVVVVRKKKDGHREGVVRVKIGLDSSDEIPSGTYKVITQGEIDEARRKLGEVEETRRKLDVVKKDS